MSEQESQRAGARSEVEDRSAAFTRLTQTHLQSAYRLASAIMRDRDAAQDAVHEAIVSAWTRWSTLRDEDSFERWFDRIVVNKCLDELRRKRQARIRAPMLGETAVGQLGERETLDALREGLNGSRPEHRVVVVMRFLDDLPLTDIAELTGARLGTVKSRLHYSLRQLRAAYDAAERRENTDG